MTKFIWPAVMREAGYELIGIHAEDAAKVLGVVPIRDGETGQAKLTLTPPQKQALEAMGHQVKVFPK